MRSLLWSISAGNQGPNVKKTMDALNVNAKLDWHVTTVSKGRPAWATEWKPLSGFRVVYFQPYFLRIQ